MRPFVMTAGLLSRMGILQAGFRLKQTSFRPAFKKIGGVPHVFRLPPAVVR
jgi:hypothetical protein